MAKGSDPETKGGGLHGPPKRWTGGGPRPARHIPWPELFKHHLSVLTGHLKMMDMVRKHCVEGTGNYDTAKACVDRTHQMMRMFKEVAHNFVPPKDNVDRVPLGASSASMYPGYSPADHIYGEAAQEYGERAAELKRKGLDLKLDPNGPQYVVGQSKKPRRLTEEAEEGEPIQLGSMSSANANDVEGQDEGGEPMDGVEQFFVIDSKPTPMADLGDIQKHKNKANDKVKRRVSFKDEQEVESTKSNGSDEPKRKKAKLDAANPSPAAVLSKSTPQEEDIAAEVEARLKAKEEKRRRKEEKKRKRDSGDSVDSALRDISTVVGDGDVKTSSAQKDKMEMIGQNEAVDAAEPSSSANNRKKSKKDKKMHKPVGDVDEQEAAISAERENEKPKKKRKKDTTSSSL